MNIRAKEVSFRYSKAHEEALNGLNFEVKDGEIFGFPGPSGAGKSTTLGILPAVILTFIGTPAALILSGQSFRISPAAVAAASMIAVPSTLCPDRGSPDRKQGAGPQYRESYGTDAPGTAASDPPSITLAFYSPEISTGMDGCSDR
jgi:energy-coupling factor transporter ATP-binding protein EcfA2